MVLLFHICTSSLPPRSLEPEHPLQARRPEYPGRLVRGVHDLHASPDAEHGLPGPQQHRNPRAVRKGQPRQIQHQLPGQGQVDLPVQLLHHRPGPVAAKYLVYAAALKKQQAMDGAKVRYSVEAAQAKLIAARTASDVTRRCLQLFGGYGYTRDYPIERMMRDAKITEIYEGTSEVQMMVISGALLK